MTISQIPRAWIVGAVIIVVVFLLAFALPTTYVRKNEFTGDKEYVTVTDRRVVFISVNPSCETPLEEVEPSEGFGTAFVTCEKRYVSAMNVESRVAEDDAVVSTLKYEDPGERGGGYSVELSVQGDIADYHQRIFTKPFVLVSAYRTLIALPHLLSK